MFGDYIKDGETINQAIQRPLKFQFAKNILWVDISSVTGGDLPCGDEDEYTLCMQ